MKNSATLKRLIMITIIDINNCTKWSNKVTSATNRRQSITGNRKCGYLEATDDYKQEL